MCYQPIHIKNPKIHPSPFRDTISLDVPCGKCEQCEHAKILEWTTRAYYEFLDTKRHGGCTLYLTLTYNNKHLPKINDIPVFSKRDVQLFMKRFRKFFNTPKIKYFCTSEYGGKKHRPHYHMLVYVPRFLPYLGLLQKISSLWGNGYVAPGSLGLFVNGFGAISYVAKYLAKDIDFPNMSSLEAGRPFHLQSRGFGEYIIEHFQLYDLTSQESFKRLVNGYVLVPDLKQGYKKVFIPQYVSRKILYDLEYELNEFGEKVPRWYINEYGCKVKRARFEQQVTNTAQRFKDLFNNIENIIYDPSRLEMYNRITHSDFTTSSAIRIQFLKTDFKEVAMYAGLYKGLSVLPVSTEHEELGIDLPLFSPFSVELMLDSKFGELIPDKKDAITLLTQKCFHTVAAEYERTIELINGLFYVKGFYAAVEEQKRRNLRSQLKILKVS